MKNATDRRCEMTTPRITTMAAAILLTESGLPKCKYMVEGLLSHRLCSRKGRCVGCSTEEMALERTAKA